MVGFRGNEYAATGMTRADLKLLRFEIIVGSIHDSYPWKTRSFDNFLGC